MSGMNAQVDTGLEHVALVLGAMSASVAAWRAYRSAMTERYAARRARDKIAEDVASLMAEVQGDHGSSLRDAIDRIEAEVSRLADATQHNRDMILQMHGEGPHR